LRLQGEHEYGVPPLADAPALFMERVAAVRPDVVWDEENVRAAHDICHRVDGLPLAVELVAAGARMLPPRSLLEHLGPSFGSPASGRRDAPARQQTVRATIDWSYELLEEPERDLFERLGVFGGSFTIEAVRAVAGGDGPAGLASLSALVEKSLVASSASTSETRMRLLHVIAEYAAERLATRPDADDVNAAHAAYYLDLARAAYAGLRGSEQRGWKEVLDAEIENVRRALAFLADAGRLDDAAEIVWSVWVHWLTGHFLEGRKIVAELLAAPGELSERARARLRTVDGVLAALLADLPAAHAQLGTALEWLEAHDDDEARASALGGLGIATAAIDPDRARALLLESASLFAATDDAWGEAIVLGALGWLDTGRGDFTEERLFERAYSLARHVDNDIATAHAATNLAELHLGLGRSEDAREALDVALTAYDAVRLYDGLSYGLEAAAGLASSEGRSEEAARLLGAADGLRHEVGVPIWGARLTRFEAQVASVRAALGEDLFDSSWSEGRAFDYESALEHARVTLRPNAPDEGS
jgi:tetratricopeptide (TPR) repeat protein